MAVIKIPKNVWVHDVFQVFYLFFTYLAIIENERNSFSASENAKRGGLLEGTPTPNDAPMTYNPWGGVLTKMF